MKMKKKSIGILSCICMTLALLIVSCGTQEVTEETQETTGDDTVKITETTTTTTTTQETPVSTTPKDTPEYGGRVTVTTNSDPMGFDETFTIHFQATTLKLTHDELTQGDWARGPAGTGEYTWAIMGNILLGPKTGAIAESWEIVEPGHIIFNIRKGVRYALDPASEASRMVGGRELNAQDVVWTLKRYVTEDTAYIKQMAPGMAATVQITAPDDWTVDVRCPREEFVWVLSYFPDFASIMPPEVTEQYGDMRDWKNSVGSGPFILTDYVPSSNLSFRRNDNYWQTDPVGPGKGNQLPYLDGITMLIVPDASTRLAALRTGGLDQLGGLGYDDANIIKNMHPELKYTSTIPESGNMLYMRIDKPELPFKDVRVRHALMMATDFDTLNEDLYGGEAVVLSFPVTPVPEYLDAYLPLEECPAAVRELYTYNPERAKELLSEAGYPNGFKTKVLCHQDSADYLSVLQYMWQQIGVELEIETMEIGALMSLKRSRTHEEMIFIINASVGTYIRMLNYNGPGADNASGVDDAHARELRDKMLDAWYVGDEAAVNRIHREEVLPYVLEQAWVIPSPLQRPTTFWWPWLKGYHGESSPGNNNVLMWTKYSWVDRALKKQMGY